MFGTQQVTLVSPRLTVISIFGEKIDQQGCGRPQTERDEHELFFFPEDFKNLQKKKPVITGCKHTTLDETHVHTQVRSYLPLPHISFRPALWVCSKGFKAAVTERKGEGGREVSREGKGLSGGSWQRSLAVGESQRGAYHCLSLIHHDRDREGLNNREGKGDRGENKGENVGRGANTDEDKRKFMLELYDFNLAPQAKNCEGASF